MVQSVAPASGGIGPACVYGEWKVDNDGCSRDRAYTCSTGLELIAATESLGYASGGDWTGTYSASVSGNRLCSSIYDIILFRQ